MRRIILMATVAALVAAMLAFGAAPAMADDDSSWWDNWGNPVDINNVTDADFNDGAWDIEATGEFFGTPADFELVCDWWGFCQLEDVDLA